MKYSVRSNCVPARIKLSLGPSNFDPIRAELHPIPDEGKVPPSASLSLSQELSLGHLDEQTLELELEEEGWTLRRSKRR